MPLVLAAGILVMVRDQVVFDRFGDFGARRRYSSRSRSAAAKILQVVRQQARDRAALKSRTDRCPSSRLEMNRAWGNDRIRTYSRLRFTSMRTTMSWRVAGASSVRIEGGLVADVLPQKLAAIVLRQPRAAVKRIDDAAPPTRASPLIAIPRTKQEMTREIDAVHVQAGPARDLEVHDREADGDAGAAIEYLVDEAVAGIVVALPVARESLLVVQVLVECAHGVAARVAHPRRRFFAHAIEVARYGPGSSDGYSTRAMASAADARSSPGAFMAFCSSAADFGRASVEVQGKRHGWILAGLRLARTHFLITPRWRGRISNASLLSARSSQA